MNNRLALLVALFITVCTAFAPRQHGHMKHHMGGMGLMSMSGFGGSAGCVVTGNKLYANGYYLRDLTSAETNELQQYQSAMQNYKTQLQAAIQQRRDYWQQQQQAQGPQGGGMFGGRRAGRQQQMQNQNGNNAMMSSPPPMSPMPQPPSSPSFCNSNDTTQYVFDGCMVQNNKVYVGGNYARDLSQNEIQQLNVFAAQMSAYQNYIAASIQQQVQGIFGNNNLFNSLFGASGYGGSGYGTSDDSTSTPSYNDYDGNNNMPTTTGTAPTTSAAPPQPPTPPNFCTTIL